MRKPKHSARMIALALLFFGAQWTGSLLYAQNRIEDGWKSERITLRISNQSLGNVLQEVAKAAGATIVFQGVSLVGIDQATTLNVSEKPLDEVLRDLIGNQAARIRYEGNRQIIVEALESLDVKQGQSSSLVSVSGIVYDAETNQPLEGATILITDGTKNGKGGNMTDKDGKFSLQLRRKESIRVTYLGYEAYSLQVKNSDNDLKIMLQPNSINIEEAVVTGISKRKKNSFTGNFITVKGADLRKLNPQNVLKSLEFFDPSFKIVENNRSGSDPNALPEFQMRGDQSLGSGTSMNSMDLLLDNVSSRPNTPLFVLDGFIVSIRRVLELDPERIENITILKDAAATSIYGSRASNGVVVVETKVAPDGALTVSYNHNLTLQLPDLSDYNMMNAREKLETEWKAGIYNPNNDRDMNEYNRYLRNVLAGVDTYWLSQPLRSAWQSRHSLTAAGGTDAFRYTLGLNAALQPGVMKGSGNDNFGINFNMSYRRDRITVGANITLNETKGNNSPYGSFSNYTSINPYYRPTDENGDFLRILDNHRGSGGSQVVTNPLYDANVGIKDFSKNFTIVSALNLEYRLTSNLRVSEQISYTRGMARTERFLPAAHSSFVLQNDLTLRGSYNKNSGEMSSWSSNLGVNWNISRDKHLISLLGNWTVSEDRSNYVALSATGYPNANMNDFIFGNKMSNNPSGTEAISRAMGLIGQFSYSYDNRYSVDFNLSSEMSSRFAADQRIAPFWSTGVRWNAFREKWLEGRVSNLVFRATYGVTGEQNFSPYQAIEFYTFNRTMRPYTSFENVGAVLSTLNNPNLGWARTDNFSLGVDFGFWKNRVNMAFNYYNNITRELLTDYDLAPSTGFESQTINAGELQNKGFDLSLNVIAFQDVKKQFYWTIGANANHNRNKIRKISDYLRKINEKQLSATGAPLPIYQEGESTTTLFTVPSLGIDPATGKEVYLKRNGEKTFVWDATDKVPVGDIRPDVSGTITSTINWRDLSFGLGFSYQWGGVLYNQTLVDKLENSRIDQNLDRRAMTERWEQPGDIAFFKGFAAAGNNTPQSSRFIMKNNELKLNSLNVGYRLRSDKYVFLNRLNIEMLNVGFTTNDLFRLSTIRMERGLAYPFARSYTLTLSILFK